MELRSGTLIPPPVPAEQDAYFREGVKLCFMRWTALQLAVENQWGGARSAEKARQLQSGIIGWFYHAKGQRYADELEDVLDEGMLNSFNTETEDGSLQQVAEKLVSLYEACSQGNYGPVIELRAQVASVVPGVASSRKAANEGGEDGDSGSDIDEDDQERISGDPGTSGALGAADSAMDLDQSDGAKSSHKGQPVSALSQEEVADGWEMAPSRSRRGTRGKS